MLIASFQKPSSSGHFYGCFQSSLIFTVFFIFVKKKKRENVYSYLDKLFKKRENVNIAVWSQLIMDYFVFSIIFKKSAKSL